jgi:EAL and modified HD-GYP domain-containing signal transduction protein
MSAIPSAQLFLGRQPILGREQQLLAYALFFRDGMIATGNRADRLNPAPAALDASAFTELAAADALGPYRGFIAVDAELLFSELIEALPPQFVTLELGEKIVPSAEVIARCQQLHERGFALAAGDAAADDESYRPLLALADIVKIDIAALDADRLRERVSRLKPCGKKLLAENVDSAEQLALCQSLGFDLFQGYYFARPTIIAGNKLDPSQLALLRLLALVLDDAETTAVENAFKREPGLTVNLLRLTNSVSSGLATTVTSLRHAITIVGRRQLQRWLQLLIYTTPKGSAPGGNPLLQLAATRGRLMELLAERVHAKNREFAEQAFMVGIMSLMPALLGTAMPEIVAQLPLAERVRQALIDRRGQHGQLLQLVEATEQLDPFVLEEALRRVPGVSADFLDHCLASALAWANGLGQEQGRAAAGPSPHAPAKHHG